MNILYMGFKTFLKDVVVYLYDDKKEIFEIFLNPTSEQIRDFLVQYTAINKSNVYLCFPNLYEIFHIDGFRTIIGDIIREGGGFGCFL